MTNSRSTKNALVASVLMLALCFSMLLGTTFAWFTDTASSNGNKITSGTLDVQLWQWTAADAKTDISANSDPVFGEDIIWEPNRTEVVYLSIKNNGSLALKYKVALDVTPTSEVDLTEVMEYAITPDAQYGDVTGWAGNGVKVVPGTNPTAAVDVELLPGAEHFFALSIHMDKDAGNKYQGQSIEFDIAVLAGQASHEAGSLGDGYDANAAYPAFGSASAAIDASEDAQTIDIFDDQNRSVGSVTIPAEAAADDASEYKVKIVQDEEYNYAVEAGKDATTYDITVEGIKENNDQPIKVKLNYIPGLAKETVKVYHKNETTPVPGTIYDPTSGYVIFEVTEFSPYTIVADVTSVYVAPEIGEIDPDTGLPEDLPVANILDKENSAELMAQLLAEGNAEFAPYALESVYKFICVDTPEEAAASPYAAWACDFYVKLDRDLGEEQIFLGGNYGIYGWVGFTNADITLEAGEEIPLLGSVTKIDWTYEGIASLVGEFVCGVGDVDDALSGATFTVMLRLTNPENEAEFFNVATINYTFD